MVCWRRRLLGARARHRRPISARRDAGGWTLDDLRAPGTLGPPYEFWEDLLGAHNYGPL